MTYSLAVLSVIFVSFSLSVESAFAQNTKAEKMKVEVWSDVVCPFCYIGKTNFDKAMAQFEEKENIKFVWKSFQLYPDVKTNLDISLYEHLSTSKGITIEQVKGMAVNAAQMGKASGLNLDFDKSVVANSFNAHRLVHFAKENGLQLEMKERLFKAFFTEGQNIDDTETLIALAGEIGLDANLAKAVLESDKYADAVQADIRESQQLGVRGVPFFVFNRTYAVSGAQAPEGFLETLEKSFAEWRQANPTVQLKVTEGPSCEPNKVCE
ncbi:MAG: putative DsbA family dithiol-disulfide isomerase [Bacteroidia bacterium]|jgi:predicted DsbA family dithiol-disulfide isomerase